MSDELKEHLGSFSEYPMFELPDAMVITDDKGKILECNQMTVELFRGNSVADLRDSFIYAFTHPSEHRKARASLKRLLQGKPLVNSPFQLVRLDGTQFPGELSASPISSKQGKIIGTIGILRDISKREEIHKLIEEQEKQYLLLFNTANDAIFLVDEDIFLECNSKTLELFGCSKEEIIGHSPYEFSPEFQPDGRLSQEKALEKIHLALAGENQRFEWRHCRLDKQEFDSEVSLNSLVLGGKKILQAIVRDISERKETEKKLQAMAQDLFVMNEAKDKFFSILAHDLKGPFNAILGFSEVLTSEWDRYEDHELQHFIRNIQQSANRAYKLLLNLLEWSRSQTGRMEYHPALIDLSGIVNETILLQHHYAESKEIKIFSDINFNTLVFADENMLRTVLRNLIENAVKYSHSGGKVTVEIETASARSQEFLTVVVKDNGVGIPEKEIPKLFAIDQEFKMPGTADEKGTGLGLILCKELVEKNKGTIHVESQQGKGSRFSFTIPLKGP